MGVVSESCAKLLQRLAKTRCRLLFKERRLFVASAVFRTDERLVASAVRSFEWSLRRAHLYRPLLFTKLERHFFRAESSRATSRRSTGAGMRRSWGFRVSKVGRIVYGAGREDVHAMYFEARHVDTLSFVTKAYRDDLTIEAACCAINARNFTIGRGTGCPRRSREISNNSLSRYDAGTARMYRVQ